MKSSALLLCLFVFGFPSFAQTKKVSFSQLQLKSNDKGISVYFLDGLPFTGTTHDDYQQEQIHREVSLKNGLLEKEKGWYNNGNKEREYLYKDGLLHGKLYMFHRNGNVYLEENYSSGVNEGKQFLYNCDGSLQAEWDKVGGFTLMMLEHVVKECQAGCTKMTGC